MLQIKSENAERKTNPIEAGTYIARCVQIIDLGEQFNDIAGKYYRKTMLTFELPSERVEINNESKPRLMSKTYTFSLGEKATLRKDIESWFGRKLESTDYPFDLGVLLGKACMLTVVVKKSANGKEYSNIASVGKPMKGIAIPEQETDPFVFDLDAKPEEVLEAIETLPEWIAKTIKESPTYKLLTEPKEELTPIQSDDLPF